MRQLKERLRRRWQGVRPLPRPAYVAGTPSIAGRAEADLVRVPNMQTLAAAATSTEAQAFVMRLLERLTASEETEGQRAYYRLSKAQFGEYWRFADLPTTLWAAATLVKPETYLEIGVHRGRSAAIVAAVRPDCAIYGFDVWLRNYTHGANPGPAFVRSELESIGHKGELTLVSGDSAKTVPATLRSNPDLYFDLITVDGDHSALGAARDMANVLPRLKVGGVIVFDDLNSAPVLRRVWRELVQEDSRYLTWEFIDAGFGVGAAVRVSDDPLLETLNRQR